MSESGVAGLTEQFFRLFGPGGKTHALRAPGRVNLIGEHTDYNQGLVFPMAIEPQVLLVCRLRSDEQVKIASTVFPGEFAQFSLSQKIEPMRGKHRGSWQNYVRGVAACLIGAGIPLSGIDALISNTLAVGGGLSSSAALEIAVAKALLIGAGLNIDPTRLALICQKAEQDFPEVPCGIMDQMAVAASRAGHAMLLDCRDLSTQYIPIDFRDLRVLIANTMIRHEHSGGEYAMRRKQCEEGLAALKRHFSSVRSLRDVTAAQLETARGDLSEVVHRRCRHVIGEIARTSLMAQKLSSQYYDAAGELMLASHKSLRDDYEVSCAELDFLVEQAMIIKGVYGARMTGGGFGGCIVALVQSRAVEPLTGHLHQTYTARFERQPSVLVTTATDGAGSAE